MDKYEHVLTIREEDPEGEYRGGYAWFINHDMVLIAEGHEGTWEAAVIRGTSFLLSMVRLRISDKK
jgi:hypothetical protein